MNDLLKWLNISVLRFRGCGTIIETFDIDGNIFKVRILRRVISYKKTNIPITLYISIKDPIINNENSFMALVNKLESIPKLKLLIENITNIEIQNYFITNDYKLLTPEFDSNEITFIK